MKPTKLRLKVKEIDWQNAKVVKIIFTPIEPAEMDFIPGQHMGLVVGEGVSRPYCFFTSNEEKDVGILVSAGHDGVGANFIKDLKVGDTVEGFGPVGRTKINTDYANNIVFVATGTGIAPMLSMLDKMATDKVSSTIKLYFGLRNEDDLFVKDKLDSLKVSLQNFDYSLVYSKPKSDRKGLTGRVTDVVKAEENTQYYVIGHRQMVIEMEKKLETGGVSRENIIS